ncbi:uncharacterized protein PAC_14470 [Phialocephala subalpina]|uniref:DUF7053 domain-containing protein n=1 Tax=Phialocephala subalpina TaxID=576137 RepID=A0A1L7XHR7_9HELO|nr:uncharacterized protein PAC_14470 [Phialocephala subalpina]
MPFKSLLQTLHAKKNEFQSWLARGCRERHQVHIEIDDLPPGTSRASIISLLHNHATFLNLRPHLKFFRGIERPPAKGWMVKELEKCSLSKNDPDYRAVNCSKSANEKITWSTYAFVDTPNGLIVLYKTPTGFRGKDTYTVEHSADEEGSWVINVVSLIEGYSTGLRGFIQKQQQLHELHGSAIAQELDKSPPDRAPAWAHARSIPPSVMSMYGSTHGNQSFEGDERLYIRSGGSERNSLENLDNANGHSASIQQATPAEVAAPDNHIVLPKFNPSEPNSPGAPINIESAAPVSDISEPITSQSGEVKTSTAPGAAKLSTILELSPETGAATENAKPGPTQPKRPEMKQESSDETAISGFSEARKSQSSSLTVHGITLSFRHYVVCALTGRKETDTTVSKGYDQSEPPATVVASLNTAPLGDATNQRRTSTEAGNSPSI